MSRPIRQIPSGSRQKAAWSTRTLLLLAMLLPLQWSSPASRDAVPRKTRAEQPVQAITERGRVPTSERDPELTGRISSSWYADANREIALSEYEIRYQPSARCHQSPNRGQNLRVSYLEDGFTLSPRVEGTGAWNLSLRLEGIAKGGVMLTPRAAHNGETPPGLCVEGNTLRVEHDGFALEYSNNPKGMRQDFIVEKKPQGEEKLRVELRVEGDFQAVAEGERGVRFIGTEDPRHQLRYSQLKAWDADGRELASHVDVQGEKIALVVDDDGARYPVTVDPLSTTPGWIVESNQVDANLGHCVAGAGDIDNDGYSDVIVGAPYFDNGQSDEGRAYVYFGSASGLPATADWTVDGGQAEAWLGYSVASAGDVNNDGYDDIIIGANGYDNGQIGEGRALVYQGSASGLAATPDWTYESDIVSTDFGICVAGAGDVNNDGCDDIVVGAVAYTNGDDYEGRAYVFHGSISGLATSPDWTAEGNGFYAYFGNSVMSAGDVNNDGYDDVVVGAPNYSNDQASEGKAYVYHGSASGLAATPNWTAEGDQVDVWYGNSVSTAGDVNNDGYADIIVGAPVYDNGQTDEGRAYVYHGSSSGISATADWIGEIDQADAQFGLCVASAGDLNNDGFSDVIVGAPYDANGESYEGRAYIFHGSAAGLGVTPTWIAESNQAGASFGYSVAGAGDINNDGALDVIVGADHHEDGENSEGGAFVYYGTPVETSGDLYMTENTTSVLDHTSDNTADIGLEYAGTAELRGVQVTVDIPTPNLQPSSITLGSAITDPGNWSLDYKITNGVTGSGVEVILYGKTDADVIIPGTYDQLFVLHYDVPDLKLCDGALGGDMTTGTIVLADASSTINDGLGTSAAVEIDPSRSTETVTIGNSSSRGDVDCNDRVDVLDLGKTINVVLRRNTFAQWQKNRADLAPWSPYWATPGATFSDANNYGDAKVTVQDPVLMADAILNGVWPDGKAMYRTKDRDDETAMNIAKGSNHFDAKLTCHVTPRGMNLSMENRTAVSSIQFDLRVSGSEANIGVTQNLAHHGDFVVRAKRIGDLVRVIVYSLKGDTIPTGKGQLLQMAFPIDDQLNVEVVGPAVVGDAAGNALLVDAEVTTAPASVEPGTSRMRLTLQVNPTPMRDQGILHLKLTEPGVTTLRIIDPTGREALRILDNKPLSAGSHEIPFDASELPPGMYFCAVTTGSYATQQTMLVVR